MALDQFNLHDQVAIVTGAGKGVGRGIARGRRPRSRGGRRRDEPFPTDGTAGQPGHDAGIAGGNEDVRCEKWCSSPPAMSGNTH